MGFNFICPYCQTRTTIEKSNLFEEEIIYNEDNQRKIMLFSIITCPNIECNRATIIMKDYETEKNSFGTYKVGTPIKTKRIEPEFNYKHYPEYIPEQIRQDYEEASKIVSLSPKASATLSRRCLQGMIRDFHGVNEDNLYKEIEAIKAQLGINIYNALHSLRAIGNIGAHPEQDINLIVDIDEGEAEKILKLIEFLIDKWYIAREEENKMLNDVNQIALQKKNTQNGVN
ncbi:DUF4145 domain-containing protein [Fusobacterium hwasookii]